MNSTKILFLKMLKGDIERNAFEKMGINPSSVTNKEGLLAGQTIDRSGIESFSSYKLMTSDERAMVDSILNELKTKEVGSEKGNVLLKRIDSVVPTSHLSETADYKDVA